MLPLEMPQSHTTDQPTAEPKNNHITEPGSFALIACEPRHEIFNNVVCATSKASDQPAHMRSLIRAFASRLNIL